MNPNTAPGEVEPYFDAHFSSVEEGEIQHAMRQGWIDGRSLHDFCGGKNLGSMDRSSVDWQVNREGVYRLLHNRLFPNKLE